MTSGQAATPKKIGFVSLGCPKNLVDSEVMMGLLSQGGAQITARAEDADIIVVNTCSFIDSAKQESVDTILEMAQHKIAGRAQKLIVAGCLVERYRNEIQKNIPEVDAVVGTGELQQILHAAGIEPPATASDSAFVILGSTFGRRCSRGCWTVLEGRLGRRDRRSAELSLRREHAARTGDAEVFGLHQDCRGLRSSLLVLHHSAIARQVSFASIRVGDCRGAATGAARCPRGYADRAGHDLLRRRFRTERWTGALVGAAWPGLKNLRWVRFLYAYPNKITGKLLETIAAHEKICSYIDVPLQHASPDVLKRMKRGAGAEIFLRSIEKMRREIPGLTLRTSFIVGFPGETEQDFDLLCQFVREAQFDWLGVFGYSDEDGAKAFELGDKVARKEIERRRKKLMSLQKQISRKKKRALVGQQFDLLLEGPSAETDLLWEGRTAMHAPEIDGTVYVNDFGDHEDVARGRVLPLRDHRSARLRSGGADFVVISQSAVSCQIAGQYSDRHQTAITLSGTRICATAY